MDLAKVFKVFSWTKQLAADIGPTAECLFLCRIPPDISAYRSLVPSILQYQTPAIY
jgi:hypothetical protein